MDILKEQFSAGEMARVDEIDGPQLQNVLRRSCLDLPYPVAGRRLFSAEFVARVALMNDLARYGMGPHQASSLIVRVGRNVDDSVEPWLASPTGREEMLISPDANGGHHKRFFEDGFVSYILKLSKDPKPKEESFFNDDQSWLILPVGAIIKSTYEKLVNILRERTEGAHAV